MSFESPEKKVPHHEDIGASHPESSLKKGTGSPAEIRTESGEDMQPMEVRASEGAGEGFSEHDKTLQAEAEKTERLEMLDFKAHELAREDRAAADQLLLKMKDQAFSRAAGTHDALAENEEGAREKLDYALRARPEQADKAIQDLKDAQANTIDFERTIVKPTAERLAREKDPIAKSDPEGEGKKNMATFFGGPLAPLIRLIPGSFFRGK